MAYRRSLTGAVGHGRTEGKNENHMVRGMLSQKACLWDCRSVDRRRMNFARIYAIWAVFARCEAERGGLGPGPVSS